MIANVKATKGIGNDVLKKTIHKGSESIMFSVLQETQYMYPFKSSVREIVSNSLDSISEKKNALKILKKEIEIEDLFIEKKGEEFNDSRFDASYYDKEWLSDINIVKIRYIENDSTTRDRIQFIDEGVSLGGSRLVNYFSLGFSTKRLSKSQLGSFGLGAKSLLATGVDFYTVTSFYNGKKFMFNIFKDHVISITPKFNEETKEKNPIETFYNDFSCHYETTIMKNKVIVEAEVKRHRKQDYINAIENQLGFIDNVEFLISDNLYNIRDSKRKFKSKVLYKTDKIMIGESDYYARPQILLKPGIDSDIYINYGPINFDELEMKRYSGNVSFIMNINDVDVTPSRESVIWNTKTRDAIKNMFIEAQNTIIKVMQDKIKGATSLPEHLNMLEGFKSNNSMSSMSELYKVIDVSTLELSYKTFNLSKVALLLKDEKKFSMTSTSKSNGWSSSSAKDTDFTSKMSKKYISYLYPKNNNFNNTIVYIGGTRYKDLARYVDKKFIASNNSESINIIFFKDTFLDTYLKIHKELILKDGGIQDIEKDTLDTFIENAYIKEEHENILIGEIFKAINVGGLNVLYEEDIDKSEMKKIGEVADKVEDNRYMTAAERAKLENKISCNQHYEHYKYKVYKNENDIIKTLNTNKKVIIYKEKHPINESLNNSYYNNSNGIFDRFLILGLSEEGFRRFSKINGISILTDMLYTINFGDITITEIGEIFLPSYIQRDIKNGSSIDKDHALSFLNDTFTGITIDKTFFNRQMSDKVEMLKIKRKRKREELTRKEAKESTKIFLKQLV